MAGLFGFFAVAAVLSADYGGEATAAHELAAEAAAPLWPQELGALFSRYPDAFYENLLSPAPGATAGPPERSRHSVCMDAAAGTDDESSRRAAARAFPRRRADARSLYDRHGQANCGWLPWVIEEQQKALLAALKSGDGPMAAAAAGALMHFAVDATLPFNAATAGVDAKDSAAGDPEVESPADPGVSGRMRLRDRFHGALLIRLSERLRYEARVFPSRLHPTSDALDAAMAGLVQTHSAAEALRAVDAEVIRELGLDDVQSFVASADVYAARLAERCAPILESQIEAGALLSANLIVGAWVEAGKPRFDGPKPQEAEPESPAVAAPPSGELLGSLGSTVYHRASCTHCARIKPENTVRFATPEEAEAAGRKPCRACTPNVK